MLPLPLFHGNKTTICPHKKKLIWKSKSVNVAWKELCLSSQQGKGTGCRYRRTVVSGALPAQPSDCWPLAEASILTRYYVFNSDFKYICLCIYICA